MCDWFVVSDVLFFHLSYGVVHYNILLLPNEEIPEPRISECGVGLLVAVTFQQSL